MATVHVLADIDHHRLIQFVERDFLSILGIHSQKSGGGKIINNNAKKESGQQLKNTGSEDQITYGVYLILSP